MCLNCMFEVLTKYVYRFQTTFPRALPLLHHDTFELLRQLQGVKGLGTAVWLSKEMALAELELELATNVTTAKSDILLQSISASRPIEHVAFTNRFQVLFVAQLSHAHSDPQSKHLEKQTS